MSNLHRPLYSEIADAYEQLLREYVKLYDSRAYSIRARDTYVVRMATAFLDRMKGSKP